LGTSTKKAVHFGGLDKENDSLSINQRLENEKKASICKIEEYYSERNEALEARIAELKELKDRIVRDQKLLLRNNEEIEGEIETRRQFKEENTKLSKLQMEVRALREKIREVEEDSVRVAARKRDFEKHVKEVLKGHKANLRNELQARPKSTSENRCKYH
jgi:chromosome segregation ATPase